MGSVVRGNSRKGTKRNRDSLDKDTGEPKRARARKAPQVAPIDGDTSTEEQKITSDGPEVGRTKKATEPATARSKSKSPLKNGTAIAPTSRFAKKAADSQGGNEAGPSTSKAKTGAVRRRSVSPSHSSGSSSAITVKSTRRKGSRRRSGGKSLEPGGATKSSGRGRKRSRSSRGRKGHPRSRRQSRSISSISSVAGKRAGKRSRRSRSNSSRRSARRKNGEKHRRHSTSTGSQGTTPNKGRKSGRRSESRPSSRGRRRRTKI